MFLVIPACVELGCGVHGVGLIVGVGLGLGVHAGGVLAGVGLGHGIHSCGGAPAGDEIGCANTAVEGQL